MSKTLIAKSDLLDIKADHGVKTILLLYTNDLDLDNISYSTVPKLIFGIRIDAKFSKPRELEEKETAQLSDGNTIEFSGSIKDQIQLSTGVLPFHIHQIIKRALLHNFKSINGIEYSKEETYEQADPEEKSEFVSAKIWLTPKEEGYLINVYGTV